MEGFIWLIHPVLQSFKRNQGRSSKWACGKFKATRCKCCGRFKATRRQGQHLFYQHHLQSIMADTQVAVVKKPTDWAGADAKAQGGLLPTGLLLTACSACSLTKSRTISPAETPFTMSKTQTNP